MRRAGNAALASRSSSNALTRGLSLLTCARASRATLAPRHAQVVAHNPELRMTRGRKVVEVRPKVNWHKGTALDHLLGALGLRARADVVAIYIGDDHTDEDAFRVLRDTQQGARAGRWAVGKAGGGGEGG